MVKIYDNKTIVIHRGDTVVITVAIKQENGSSYSMVTGDKLKFTVRESASRESSVLIEKEFTSAEVRLESSETDIPAGKYSCDIQLTKKNGDVLTIFPELNKKGMEYNFRNFVVDAEVSEQ